MRMQLVPRHGNRPKVMALEDALVATCPLPSMKIQRPTHSKDILLVMYGAGAPDRTALLRAHRAAGGHVICFDRGYFGRSDSPRDEHYRIAIDELHVSPSDIQMTSEDPSRFSPFGIALREDYKENGHVVVVGMGPKSRAGLRLHDWEQKSLAQLQKRFPSRRILYRPKVRGVRLNADGVRWKWIDSQRPIELILQGASLVVARHSNVSVDACIAGIPVECEDGAARWLYTGNPKPGRAQRLSFLNRVAWWNWRVDESSEVWKFLLPRIPQ